MTDAFQSTQPPAKDPLRLSLGPLEPPAHVRTLGTMADDLGHVGHMRQDLEVGPDILSPAEGGSGQVQSRYRAGAQLGGSRAS